MQKASFVAVELPKFVDGSACLQSAAYLRVGLQFFVFPVSWRFPVTETIYHTPSQSPTLSSSQTILLAASRRI